MTRVLVARLDSVGDVLLCGPAVRAIAETDGVTEVCMLCSPQGAPAAELLPGVSRVLTWSCPWISDPAPEVGVENTDELLRVLDGSRPDEAIILTSFHQSPLPLALIFRLLGIPKVTGASVDHAGSLLDVRLCPGEDFPEDQPEAHRAMAIARAAGYPGEDDRLAVLPAPDMRRLTGDEPYFVVHPGAAVPSRRWPAEHHAVTVERLLDRGVNVVVTGTPADRDLTARVAGAGAHDLAGLTSLSELSGVLAGASVLITGNTGPAHLAAAVGTPVVSLFSPVVPAVRWAPWGVPFALLGDQDAPCRNTRSRQCPIPGHPCLSNVTPDEVIEASFELLARAAQPDARGAALR
ncbi:glycosyltransferase family 9 protein [Parafrigoribacterium soli]|uniref:glycosyltransferase family 9 protein n=1 Tax=Parafrigoribacterium soli TaxID=3144663 RepID=UPI0032EB8B1E